MSTAKTANKRRVRGQLRPLTREDRLRREPHRARRAARREGLRLEALPKGESRTVDK